MLTRVRILELAARTCVVALLALVAFIGNADARPQAVDVRVGEHPDKTRFVLELSEKLDYRLFTLADPYRVVVDFPELDWRAASGERGDGAGLVERYRVGMFRPGTFRIVLDLNRPVSIDKVFTLPPRDGKPHRFVLDIKSTGAGAFAREMKQSAGGHALASAAASSVPGGKSVARGPRTDKRRVVAIDAGHGGVDPGAISVSGVHEKTITLPFARELRQALESTGRYKAVLTRDRDVFLRLRQRVAIARAAGAELFVSVHADTIADKSVRGLSVYTLSQNASDRVAQSLADSENKADLIAGVDLSTESDDVTSILIDLAQRETMNLSARFAGLVVEEARQRTPVLRRPQRSAGFAVLKAPDMPSALIELGFLSNRHDEKALKSRAHRAKIVQGIVGAIDRYFATEETWSRL